MNTLYAYGCSYTHGYLDELGKGWVPRLKLKNKVNLVNRGHAGAGWVTVRSKILEDVPKFKFNDIVVVQVPFLHRIEVPYFQKKYDSFMRFWNEHPEGTEEWLKYVLPQHQLEAVTSLEVLAILDMLSALKVKVLWWQTETMPTLMTCDYPLLRLDGYLSFFDWNHSRPDLMIDKESNDTHLTSEGYEYLAYIFSKQINRCAFSTPEPTSLI